MPGQIIVYCDTVAKTVRLARLLGCVCYHRQVGSRGEKAELVRQLTEGRQQVFTATNALGLGVDAPTIRVVIHIRIVRKLRDYAQESGRAGRDGQKSEAIIVRGERYRRDGSMQEGNEEMREFITTNGCMRVVLDREMDGRIDRVGCEADEEKCSRCAGCETGGEAERAREDENRREDEGDGQEAGGVGDEEERVAFDQEGRARRMAAQREMELQTEGLVEIQGLEEVLDEWKEGCQRCRAWGEGCEGHRMAECTATDAEEICKGVTIIASSIQWERFSCCFKCGIPQAICKRYESRADGG
ncbi:P-loop containing nucleoside triphosphate hydrolase protein [Boeremia exigua]|uniref:P-loop containing nucleoside triphosphate hydrolase protein n=1 Tax=Boeremia exigua TaxID=749465 RepID=UPI001E8CEA4E|nr:P-loop containing nucleoside triphosphate hydrolase protein [Boeremia exigua]KAH6612356.1 P-loop containing nucleoside triphosphate hydrolase protein [Boeremia exigua]